MQADSASYRDPAGRVYTLPNGNILRSVTEAGRADFEFVESIGIAATLMQSGMLTPYHKLPHETIPSQLANEEYVLEHDVIPFISYPYEWCFGMLKSAALAHLDLHLACLEDGVTLSDASAYNIQFIGARPQFIDRLSLIPYREGMPWAGHRQFCEQFLVPLLWQAYGGIAFQPTYRGAIEGMNLATLPALTPFWRKCSLRYALHVGLPLALSQWRVGNVRAVHLPKRSLIYMLKQLRAWIVSLEPQYGTSVWRNYTNTHSYDAAEHEAKREAVAICMQEMHPRLLWDMGCNNGEYSQLAVKNGASYAVAFESDSGVLEDAYKIAQSSTLPILPLVMDLCAPSPDQGWKQKERAGLAQRAKADGLMALALIHHLVIGRLIPLDEAVTWLTQLAPQGIIEWVGPEDPMVKQMLATHTRQFPEYREDVFATSLGKHAHILRRIELSKTRVLYHWREAVSCL